MALLDFFKPKWKSRNPEVRLAAVRAMGDAEAAALRSLAAEDEDERVRLAAVERIGDREILEGLAGANLPSKVLQTVRGKLDLLYFERLVGGAGSAGGEAAVDRIQDPAVLERLAAEAPAPALRVRSVERIADPEALCRILEKNCGKEPARAALARIDDETLLARLSRTGASKVTRRLAEEKLAALAAEREEPARRALRDRELERLVEAAQGLSSDRDPAGAPSRLASLRLAWDQLDPEHAHPRRPAFLAAAGRFEEQQEAARRTLEAQSRQALSGAEASRAAEEAIAAVAALVGAAGEGSERSFREAEARWAAVGPDAAAPELAERFERACRDYRAAREAQEEESRRLRALAEDFEEAEARLAGEDLDGAAAALAKVEHRLGEESFRSVDPAALRTRLSAARRGCEVRLAARAEAESLARRELLCAELEALVEVEDRAAAGRRFRELQRAWRELPALPRARARGLEERFLAAAERFAASQQVFEEQQDWLRWNNKTLKEGLCAEAEALEAEADLEALAEKVKELQRRWKEVGPAPKPDAQTLWERFKAACDRSFERCRPHLEELERRRAEAAARKEELCRQAESHTESVDWKGSADALKELQSQWKEAGSLPRRSEEELYARFRRGCNRFFERRQAHFAELDEKRRQSRSEKERLCERAEALSAQPERGRARELRELQAEWKKAGPAPRDAEQALWERFRSACDRFFSSLGGERSENLRRKEALCAELEALLAAPPPDGGLEPAVADARQRWNGIGPVPLERAEALWDRFRSLCDALAAGPSGQGAPAAAAPAPEADDAVPSPDREAGRPDPAEGEQAQAAAGEPSATD